MNGAEPTTTEPIGADRPFDRQNVTESAGAAASAGVTPRATVALKNRAPSTWSGTPRSWAIVATAADVVQRQRRATGVGVRLLEDDEAGRRLVEVRGIPPGVGDGIEVHRPVGALGEGADRRPDHDRVAARLVHDGVRLGAGDRLVAARAGAP